MCLKILTPIHILTCWDEPMCTTMKNDLIKELKSSYHQL